MEGKKQGRRGGRKERRKILNIGPGMKRPKRVQRATLSPISEDGVTSVGLEAEYLNIDISFYNFKI